MEEIFKILKNESLTYDELLDLYITYLKNIKREVPNYKEDYEYYKNNYLYLNCYAYSLGLNIPKEFNEYFYKLINSYFIFYPGVFSKKGVPKGNEIIDYTLEDIELLNIKGYRIAIMLERMYNGSNLDFHYARENIDHSWSSKIGRTSCIVKNNYIEVPSDYDIIKVLKI